MHLQAGWAHLPASVMGSSSFDFAAGRSATLLLTLARLACAVVSRIAQMASPVHEPADQRLAMTLDRDPPVVVAVGDVTVSVESPR